MADKYTIIPVETNPTVDLNAVVAGVNIRVAEIRKDPISHPKHYTSHPSGVECIAVVAHMGFCLGNAMKYLWRADHKGATLEDLKKARWYIDYEIARLEAMPAVHGQDEVAQGKNSGC